MIKYLYILIIAASFFYRVTTLLAEEIHADRALEEEASLAPKKNVEIIWKREVSAGYNAASGNTRDSQAFGGFLVSRNRVRIDEITLKGDGFYSSSERKMNTQRWYGLGRYGLSLGRAKKWYGFGRLEADHDRFADIDYRLVPAAGAGYWFYDLPEIKIMVEAGAGREYTYYRSNAREKREWVLIPRAFLEKKLFNNSKITQNLFWYPIFEDFGIYRLRSETTLEVALNKGLSLRLSLTDDYNSDPPKDTKNNDLRFTSSLAYSF